MPIPDDAPDDDPIVGHTTFRDGHHEPLRQKQATTIIDAIRATEALRAEQMPDEQTAIKALFDAWLRLKELGWKEAQYCPKDGSLFDAIEMGSTGIHRCRYDGEWPNGHWWIIGDDDLYPSRPVLFRAISDKVGSVPDSTQGHAVELGAQRPKETSLPVSLPASVPPQLRAAESDPRGDHRIIIDGLAEEIDWVKHAASLKSMPVQEYIKRAINKQLREEGVDAVLFAEECPECGESLAADLKGYWCETCENYTVV